MPKSIHLLISLVLILLFSTKSHAYIDPNTGGYVFQWLFPVFSAIAAFFMFFRNTAKNIYRRIFKKNKDDKRKNVGGEKD